MSDYTFACHLERIYKIQWFFDTQKLRKATSGAMQKLCARGRHVFQQWRCMQQDSVPVAITARNAVSCRPIYGVRLSDVWPPTVHI